MFESTAHDASRRAVLPGRRHFIVSALWAGWMLLLPLPGQGKTTAAAASGATTGAAARPQRILVLGDSLSAEYGLRRDTGWVKLLERKLQQDGYAAEVVNASISGDTTAGGRQRLPARLAEHRPDIVIMELGANDALRGLALKETADNLGAMAAACEQAGAKVVLVGIQVPPNYGRKYSAEFAGLFEQVARERRAALVPFLLKGIADAADPLKWFQADRIHPKEEAQPMMRDNVWPALRPLLRQRA